MDFYFFAEYQRKGSDSWGVDLVMAFWWAVELFSCYYSRRESNIQVKSTHFFSGPSRLPILLHKCLWNQWTTWNFLPSTPVALFFHWGLREAQPHLTREGNTGRASMSVCISLILSLGEIPRCEIVGQRVLHILKLPPRNLSPVCLLKVI